MTCHPLLIIGACIVASYSSLCTRSHAEVAAPTGARLRDLAEARGLLIGVAARNTYWEEIPEYRETLIREFNFLTPENDMKMRAMRPSPEEFNWSIADTYVDFAEAHDMKMHGHTLIWHNSMPKWIENGTYNRAQLIEIMENHITTVMNHYQGRIAAWDVVNEAIHVGKLGWPDNTRRSIWRDTIGPEFIDLAYIAARKSDPSAKLIYNDFGVCFGGKKTDAMHSLVKGMLERKVPLDGVGFQMHLGTEVDVPAFRATMQRFADLGLDIYITEMDIALPIETSEEDYTEQANAYHQVMEAALAQPAVKAIQIWGFTDRFSWIEKSKPGFGNPLLFDKNYKPKAAYYAVQAELLKARQPDHATKPQGDQD